MRKRFIAASALAAVLAFGLAGCAGQSGSAGSASSTSSTASASSSATQTLSATLNDPESIEAALNLANMGAEWTHSDDAGAWTLSVVTAVTQPEIADQQGVSVCVPAAYVKGVDTNGDGTADVTEGTAIGTLVIDEEAQVTSTNGQVYTAKTAPVILNTGAAGYSSSTNTTASTTYAAEGYVNVSCGNRGKQDSVTDSNGNVTYTGDAPCCLVDQKNAARFVKYNIALGNLPGNADFFVSTGGSGGGAHATMFAATSNNPDFYDYEIAAGAVGVYKNDDGTYNTSVTVDGKSVEIDDGAWGCVAYSAITSLYEADMAEAFEYNLDTAYSFGSEFQKKVAELLAAEYKDYINGRNLSVNEAKVGFDLNGNGVLTDDIALTIEYDAEKYAATNGYGGTYLDLYLAEFTENLQWYLDNLAYAEGWTWFDASGAALSDADVAAMTTEDKARAFLEGRYAKSSSGRQGGPGGGMGGRPSDFSGGAPRGTPSGNAPSGEAPSSGAAASADNSAGSSGSANSTVTAESGGDAMEVGTPDAGTTQAAGSNTDSSNYASYADMLASYKADVAEVKAGDKYGKDIVSLYNPLNYIGAEGTSNPTWARIVMGAAEGDMPMFASLNLEVAFLNAGVDATVEWQWDGGHVPSETLGNSLALWVDMMYGEHVDGAKKITKPAAEAQTANGTEESASGTDLSSWVDASNISNVSFSLASAAAYRTAGASKAIPGFDVIDYGQEDYVFGSATADARHWSEHVLKVLENNANVLEPLFNAG